MIAAGLLGLTRFVATNSDDIFVLIGIMILHDAGTFSLFLA